jgi:energy-coupling factor transporter ATP-binding protein EcfA2
VSVSQAKPQNGSINLEVRGLSVRLAGEARPILNDLEVALEPGHAIGVSGRSGTGKTTLSHAIAGLVPWLRPAEIDGEVVLDGESVNDLDPGQRAHLLATCLDRPDAQLFLPTVVQEMEAARRLYGESDYLARVIDALGVNRLPSDRITELSSGQRQRVALAVALAGCPRPVLLDEPTAHLDADGVGRLSRILAEGRTLGGSFIINEQAGWRLRRSIDEWTELADGRLASCLPPEEPLLQPPAPAGKRVLLSARGLAIERGSRQLLSGIDIELSEGEIVLLSGANGAGKSTLAQVLAGVRRAASGAVTRTGRAVLMLPSAELQLFTGSVADEVAAAGARHDESAKVLRRHRLEHLAARAPWTLSRGERQRLVHATLDLLRPAVMIVDEPGQGLDPEDLREFVKLVHRRAEKGRGYLVISHRLELAAAAHRHLQISDGEVIEVAS